MPPGEHRQSLRRTAAAQHLVAAHRMSAHGIEHIACADSTAEFTVGLVALSGSRVASHCHGLRADRSISSKIRKGINSGGRDP
eukprot:3640310-Rhodomonas_salina.3